MKRKRLLSTGTGNGKMRKGFLFLVAMTVCFCMTNIENSANEQLHAFL
jgi:hypothetical protein